MSILIKPIITEKATLGSETLNTYTFLVNNKANKIEIKKSGRNCLWRKRRESLYSKLPC